MFMNVMCSVIVPADEPSLVKEKLTDFYRSVKNRILGGNEMDVAVEEGEEPGTVSVTFEGSEAITVSLTREALYSATYGVESEMLSTYDFTDAVARAIRCSDVSEYADTDNLEIGEADIPTTSDAIEEAAEEEYGARADEMYEYRTSMQLLGA